MKNSVINIDPEIMGGTPVFRGTRVPIYIFFQLVADGTYSVNEFLEGYPSVEKGQIEELLSLCQSMLFEQAEHA